MSQQLDAAEGPGTASPSGSDRTSDSSPVEPEDPSQHPASEQDRHEQIASLSSDALRSLAASMPLIEQAKGVLMGCYGVDAASAFAVLNRMSSSKNLKVRDLAAAVVEAVSTGVDQASTAPCERVREVLRDRR